MITKCRRRNRGSVCVSHGVQTKQGEAVDTLYYTSILSSIVQKNSLCCDIKRQNIVGSHGVFMRVNAWPDLKACVLRSVQGVYTYVCLHDHPSDLFKSRVQHSVCQNQYL